jgi:hypothetical protein
MARNATTIDPRAVFLPRITTNDARAIESVLAGPTLLDPGLELNGAMVEATYAATSAPLLERLGRAGLSERLEERVDAVHVRTPVSRGDH